MKFKLMKKLQNNLNINTLIELCDVRDGTHDSPKFIKKGIPFITTKNLINGYIDFTDAKQISKEDHEKFIKRSKVDNGDILIGMIGTIGNPVMITKKEFDFSIKNVGLIKSKGKINQQFLFYNIEHHFKKISQYKGAVIKFISLSDLRNMEIKYPTEKEQLNLVKILSKQKEIISNIEKLISKTEKMFEYFKNELLSGRKILNFENMDINSIDSSNKLNLRVVKLNDIIKFSMGNTPKKIDDSYNGNIPWITISNLKNKYIKNYTAFIKNSRNIKIIPKDTLIGSFKMSVGRFGFTTEDCCTNEAIIAIRKEDTKENLDYLYYLLPKYFNDNAEKNGQGIPLLNSKKIKDIIVNIPKLEDQNKIVDFLKKYENLIENQKKLLEKEKQKFEWLSEKLLSGEYLVVEEED